MTTGALRAAQNAAAAELATAVERRGFTGDAIKRARFKEFILGFLSVSLFHAADVWLPLADGRQQGGGEDVRARLFLFSSEVQVRGVVGVGEGMIYVGSYLFEFELMLFGDCVFIFIFIICFDFCF